MTATEAEHRITLSHKTLERYVAMMESGVSPFIDLIMIAHEIKLLGELADAHPMKAVKISTLISKWRVFGDQLRAKMN